MRKQIPDIALQSNRPTTKNTPNLPSFRPREFIEDDINIIFPHKQYEQKNQSYQSDTLRKPKNYQQYDINPITYINTDDEILEDFEPCTNRKYSNPQKISPSFGSLKKPSSAIIARIAQCLKEIQSLFLRQMNNLKQQNTYLLNKLRAKTMQEKKNMVTVKQLKKKLQVFEQERADWSQIFAKTGDIFGKDSKVCQICKCDQTMNTNDETGYCKMSQFLDNVHQQSIDELTQKFSNLMDQYRTTRNPQTRQKCAKAIKKIKQLQGKCDDNVNLLKLSRKYRNKYQPLYL